MASVCSRERAEIHPVKTGAPDYRMKLDKIETPNLFRRLGN